MFILLAVFVGALTAAQSRFNGELSHYIHNGIGAGLISNTVGSVILIVIALLSRKDREGIKKTIHAVKSRRLSWWEMLGGLGGTIFLSVQGVTVPQIGVALFTISLVSGQTASSLLVDKIGLTPSGKKPVTIARICIAVVTLFSVTLAVYPDLSNAKFKFLPIILAIVAGIVVAFQQAVNARVNIVAERPLATTFFNFIIGTFFLLIALGINLLRGGSVGSLPSSPWLYLGGVFGLTFIAVSAYTLKHVGLLNFITFSITGQLIGAILFDWLAPAAHTTVSGYLLSGTAMTFCAVVASRIFSARKGISS
jgi:bacterial/archaeal transporter family-2 protein